LQCLQYPSQINVDSLINIKHETRRRFICKGQKYLKGKINELATNSESKNIRDLYGGIHEFEMADLIYISNKMHMLQSLFYLTTALHVSGITITHLQEHKTTVTTASGNCYTILLSAAIVEELELI